MYMQNVKEETQTSSMSHDFICQNLRDIKRITSRRILRNYILSSEFAIKIPVSLKVSNKFLSRDITHNLIIERSKTILYSIWFLIGNGIADYFAIRWFFSSRAGEDNSNYYTENSWGYSWAIREFVVSVLDCGSKVKSTFEFTVNDVVISSLTITNTGQFSFHVVRYE